jgi:hypothetical protein
MATKSTQLVRGNSAQASIEITTGLLEQYDTLLDCVAGCIYQFGLKKVATALNIPAGNLSAQLNADNPDRHFSAENVDRFVKVSGDTTIVQWLAEAHLIKRGG